MNSAAKEDGSGATAPTVLSVGTQARVSGPATTANLGPGFDALGLALSWRDHVEAEVTDHGFRVEVTGLGEGTLPTDENHLMMATLLRGLDDLEASAPGLLLRSHNTIPLAGGLGSSSAAIVSALGLAWGLARPHEDVNKYWVFKTALDIEGHPDNVGPATFGGLVVAWGGAKDVTNAALHPNLGITVFLAEETLETQASRGALPETVPFREAAANSARSALLVHALASDLDLLFPGTQDFLHQSHRAGLYPVSFALMEGFRKEGLAAAISGAGPTVAVFHDKKHAEAVTQAGTSVASRLGLPPPATKFLSPGPGLTLES